MEIEQFIRSVTLHRQEFVGIARRYLHDNDEAEDAVQEALIRMWAARSRIEPPEKFLHYGRIATRNVCLDLIKTKHGTRFVTIDSNSGGHNGHNPQSLLEESENENLMAQCLKALPVKYRELLLMRNVEGLSYKNIAKMMGSTESSVRGLVARARAILMRTFKDRRNR